jgi:hypothetical protein
MISSYFGTYQALFFAYISPDVTVDNFIKSITTQQKLRIGRGCLSNFISYYLERIII